MLPCCSYVGNPSLPPHAFHKKLHHYRPPLLMLPPPPKPCRRPSAVCRALRPSSSVMEFDLYDLLGVESSSDHSRIKSAYRALQKRCHPDIAGAAGHDMAIVLNEAYSVLSDPISRSAYDKELAKMSEFRGYTGKPIYSTWLGAESEHRAVFVDEVRCVGCLRCALAASNTFAIESAHGRARVVAQWADPEHKIVDAIQTCPVDCISFVERSDLAALEFLMSKQPRGRVRIGSSASGSPSVFEGIAKFQRKFEEMNERSPEKKTQERDSGRDSRTSAIHAIRLMVDWLYWRSPAGPGAAGRHSGKSASSLVLKITNRKTPEAEKPDVDKVRAAAEKMRAESTSASARPSTGDDEYWTPALVLPPLDSFKDSDMPSQVQPEILRKSEQKMEEEINPVGFSEREDDPISKMIPIALGVVSSMVVGFGGDHLGGGGMEEHVGGKMAVEIANSFEMQVVLAGITWYLCGVAAVGLIKVLVSKTGFRR